MESDFSRVRSLKDILKRKKSTAHMVGEIEVECVYGDMELEKMLADLICE